MKTFPLIVQIHTSPMMAVIVVTGGGAQAIADLLAVPGASKTVLEALVPYSDKALAEFLGESPTQAVSIETATAMAQAAYRRALRLRDDPAAPVIGLACTATLATNRPKKGEHRAHIGLCSHTQTRVSSLMLAKGTRNRQEEERIVSKVLLHVLAEACGIDTALLDLRLRPEEQVQLTVVAKHPLPAS
ncbi:MAG: CinA family protein [Deltaproteobacteria bacterium]|nr:CinA family protein [Deltaproteobacteria bacterium]